MRKLIISEYVTLDGVMEAPGGEATRLMVFPVTIGAGLRVFPDTTKKTPWRITDGQSFPSGARVDTYQPA